MFTYLKDLFTVIDTVFSPKSATLISVLNLRFMFVAAFRMFRNNCELTFYAQQIKNSESSHATSLKLILFPKYIFSVIYITLLHMVLQA